MRGKSVLLVGGGVALILSILIVWAVEDQKWVVAAGAASAMASAVLLVGLDVWRRVSTLRPFVRTELRRTVNASSGLRVAVSPDAEVSPVPRPVAPTVQQADVVGTVRLLQAQYTGRLDRMQTSLEMALAALSEKDAGSASTVVSVPTAPDAADLDPAPDAESASSAEPRPT